MRLRSWLVAVWDLTAEGVSKDGLLSHSSKPEGGSPGLFLCFLKKLAGTEAHLSPLSHLVQGFHP